MTERIQCDNCGATLLEEEEFCGECGTPRSSTVAPVESVEAPQAGEAPASRPLQQSNADTIWRVVAAVLGAAGTLLCLMGMAVFLLFGATSSEGMTQAENWLFSAVCCLLPIGSAGITLAVAGLVIWWTRLRAR